MAEQPTARTTARVLPIDPDGRVLLLLGYDPARPESPFWFTIGGEVEPGEAMTRAAVRELAEGTGIRVEAERLKRVARATNAFSYNGVDAVNDSTYFVIAVEDVTVSFAGMDDSEVATILEPRWCSVADLGPDLPRSEPDLPEIARLARTLALGPG